MSRPSKVFFLTLLSCAPLPLFAQFNASLQGTVTDPSGGLVPNAHLTLLNNGTQAKQEGTTNEQGFYRFNQLPAGSYTVTAEATGFQKASITDIQVAADRPQTADISLQPGSIQSTVTVTAASVPALQTADASVSGTVSSEAIQTLPSYGRDVYELVRTLPGITGTGGRSGTGNAVPLGNTTGPGGSNNSIFQTENQIQVSSSGQRVTQNVYLLDGVSVNSLTWGGAAVVTPNSESVQDMTVITSDYSAEDGRNSGAHIKTTSKSGTNELHASLLFRFQNPNFNAYNKWGGPSGALPVRAENKYRQYAGSIGGPVIKNKFFYFLSYEGLKNKTQTFGQAWVLTPQYRQLIGQVRGNTTIGRIFNTVNASPRILQVLNNGCSVFGANAALACRQLPGGLDVGSPGVGTGNTPYFPNPNVSPFPAGALGGGFDGTPDLQYVQYYLPNEQVGNQFNGRFDFNPTSNDFIAVSAYVTKLNQINADSAAAGQIDADLPFKPLNTAITGVYIRNLGPTTINEVRGNFTRFADNQLTDSSGVNWGIPRIQVEGYPFGNIQAAGPPQAATTPAIFAQNTYEIRDTLVKIWGGHNVRLGGQFRWEQSNDNQLGSARPLYSFSGLWNLANSAPIFESIYADASTGGPPNSARYFRDRIGALFVQDDWHVSPSLTVNLGVRWEVFTPLTEKRGQLRNLFLAATGPQPLINAQLRPVSQFWDTNWGNVMPKFGFAYAPGSHNRFVIRGGFAMAYNRQNNSLFSNSRENNPNFFNYGLCCGNVATPFVGGQIQLNTGNGTAPNSYPANSALATGIDPTTGTPRALPGSTNPPTIEIYGAWPHTPDPYTYLYSFETQTQLVNNLVLGLGYQGAVSHHLIRLVNQNFFYPQSLGSTVDLNTRFFASYFPTPDVNSSYNAFNVHLLKQMSRGFSLDATYTWSKSIDMLSSEGPGAVTNQTDPVHAQTSEYGPSDFDSRHRFVINGLWQLPIFPKNKGLLHTLLGGWELGGILTAYSGFPWTPVTGFQQSLAPVTSAATIAPTRPVAYFGNAGMDYSSQCFIDSCNFGGRDPNAPIIGTNYFNISRAGAPGIGRNSFRGPGFFSTDASLSKRFSLRFLRESAGLEIRGYAYNVFNQLNLTPFQFGDIDTRVENNNFGRPASALAGRSIELQARFTF
jgi:Carboxypeptidase regulatory-like domain/TonB dependent receptor